MQVQEKVRRRRDSPHAKKIQNEGIVNFVLASFTKNKDYEICPSALETRLELERQILPGGIRSTR